MQFSSEGEVAVEFCRNNRKEQASELARLWGERAQGHKEDLSRLLAS